VGHADTAATSCPTDTLVPSGDACVNESFEGLTAAQDQANGVTNDCNNFNLTANNSTDGWVFILPQGDSDGDSPGEGNTFVTVTAVFDSGTFTATVTGPPTGQKAVVSAPAGSILLEAYATVTDDASTDGDNTLFFEVTGVCVATTTSSSSSSSPASSSSSSSSPASSSASSSGASGSLGIQVSTSSSASGAGGVLGVTTTTPSTGADTQFGAGLALLILGGGLIVGSTRRSKRP
jgi:hypothetical protein